MPQQFDTLRILTDRPALTKIEWCQMIENRVNTLSPYLDGYRLSELRSVECLYKEGHFGTLGTSKVVEGDFDLNTQGIFGCEYGSRKSCSKGNSTQNTGFPHYIDAPKSGKLCIWGLTRKKQWIVAIVSYEGSFGYKDRGREDAVLIRTKEVSLGALLKVSQTIPEKIWLNLGKKFCELADIQKTKHENMSEKARLIVLENDLLRIR